MAERLRGYWDDREWPEEPRYARVGAITYPVCFTSYIKYVPTGEKRKARFYREYVEQKYIAWAEDFLDALEKWKTVVLVDDSWELPRLCPISAIYSRSPIEFEVTDDGVSITISDRPA